MSARRYLVGFAIAFATVAGSAMLASVVITWMFYMHRWFGPGLLAFAAGLGPWLLLFAVAAAPCFAPEGRGR